ncbi:tripartite-type tricarboxylate transporter receptor subunit TctC [Aquabacter spiritensis]|uniref:Tripartite-type tricarboxylate transporter receptor subunit TctC n=2 Tax=Aquabacter spiritensis TaxID=933073 RepID=A0A4R3M3Q6_9HYPH|nr:tripartite-type tricarboxylate transporter receptor subunit TctC [Aquabacter spiritensis]
MGVSVGMLGRAARLAACAAMAAIALAGPAAAEFPDRNLTMVIPFPPGGPNDVIGRLVAQKMSEAFGKTVVVENRAGAGGSIAVDYVARSAPDGYTSILASMGYVVNPLIGKTPYKVSDLRPVTIVTAGPSVLVVRADLPVSSLQDLIALAKSKPGGLTYASSGNGTPLHLAAELLKKDAGLDILHVPYKGTGELMVDLAAGRVDMSIVSPLIAASFVKDGRLKAIATTGTTRMKGWENVPTMEEAGLKGYAIEAWYPVLVPAATPDAVVAALNKAIVAGIKMPDATQRLEGLGLVAVGSTVAEADAQVANETKRWSQLVKDASLKAD